MRSLAIAVAIALVGVIYLVSHSQSEPTPGPANARSVLNPLGIGGKGHIQLTPSQIAALRAFRNRPPASMSAPAIPATPQPAPATPR